MGPFFVGSQKFFLHNSYSSFVLCNVTCLRTGQNPQKFFFEANSNRIQEADRLVVMMDTSSTTLVEWPHIHLIPLIRCSLEDP